MFYKIRKWTVTALAASMILSSSTTIALANTTTTISDQAIKKVYEEVITRGASLQQYEITTATGKAKAHVTKINLKDPYLKLDTIYGTNQQLGANQSVEKMAKENNAVAAINGDFFIMNAEGAPLGPLMKDKQWISSPAPIVGHNAFALTSQNDPSFAYFSLKGSVITQNGAKFPLAGFNKTNYMENGADGLSNKINFYDENWNLNKWVGSQLDSYLAVVVQNGRIIELLESTKPTNIPENGYVLLAHGKGADFLRQNIMFGIGESIQLDYQITPTDDWSLVLGGHTLLVDQGKRANYTRLYSTVKGNRARTAIGYTQDKSTLYWIVIEQSSESEGMTFEQLSDFMISLGVYQGMNLDGGGSSTLVSRRPGDFTASLINVPKDGWQRSLPTALALYSTAPKGSLKDIFINLPSFVLKGEKINGQIKGIDNYWNPFDMTNLTVQWSSLNDVFTTNGKEITANKLGVGQLKAVSNNISKQTALTVVGKNQIQSISTGVQALRLNPGEKRKLEPTITTTDGKKRKVSANLFQWEWVGIEGVTNSDGTFTVNKEGAGWLIGSYDRFSTMVPVQVGTVVTPIDNFEPNTETNQPKAYSFSGLPSQVTGEFKAVNINRKEGVYSGQLNYNFSLATPTDMKIAYGHFGDKGITLNKEAKGMSLWVYGDNSNYWLRAEFQDGAGKQHLVTLADKVDWNGWKELKINFSETISKPTLKRIYLVDMGTDEGLNFLGFKQTTGSILFDKIELQTWNELPPKKEAMLKLYIDKPILIVNDQEKSIDQGPILLNRRSYIPARSIIEELNGQIYWDPSDRRVRILLGNKMIDLWIDDKDHIIVNGVNKTSDTAPIIRNQRTLIPVRLVMESLGFDVEWNNGEIIMK